MTSSDDDDIVVLLFSGGLWKDSCVLITEVDMELIMGTVCMGLNN